MQVRPPHKVVGFIHVAFQRGSPVHKVAAFTHMGVGQGPVVQMWFSGEVVYRIYACVKRTFAYPEMLQPRKL